ncbi:hypothetical protein [Streptomyces sp. PU-14G]|uniref:hypothetical protein n=1 Tax=Streptomyces sp. PU-14G TaxID=2800808 RepID=UPI0034DE87FA
MSIRDPRSAIGTHAAAARAHFAAVHAHFAAVRAHFAAVHAHFVTARDGRQPVEGEAAHGVRSSPLTAPQ